MNALRHNDGSKPVPDPTELTTIQLERGIESLKELIETRLDAMDKALNLFQENLTRAPTEVDKQIGHLKELVSERFSTQNEKFESVQKQFTERDARSDRTSLDVKSALTNLSTQISALQLSQKEGEGTIKEKDSAKTNNQWLIGAILGLLGLFLAYLETRK